MQIWALGRAARYYVLEAEGLDMLDSSATPLTATSPKPRPMTEKEIWDCIDEFAMASKNAIKAGFDGVEIHGANGYLTDQFTQDTCNIRTDKWGSSIENRARFAVEVASACVKAIGSERIGIRLTPWSTFQGMRISDPMPQFVYLVKQLAQLDLAYLHLVESRISGNLDTDCTEKLDFAIEAWNKTSPILLAGGYGPDTARHVLQVHEGQAIAIAFGRYFISNPDLPYRIFNSLELTK